MEVKGVVGTRQKFPDGTEATRMTLVFVDGGDVVRKQMSISLTSKPGERAALDVYKEAVSQMRKAIREAERDFAYLKHGDKWREHVTTNNYFSSPTSEDEAQLISRALYFMESMLPIPNPY